MENDLGRGWEPQGPSMSFGNAVIRVEAYDGSAVSEGCHPGIINGTVMGGQLDGRRIDVWTRITPTNSKVPTIADLQDEGSLMRTALGGYLALEDLRVANGKFTSRWVNKMGDPEADIRPGIPMQVSPSIGADGAYRRFRTNGATIYTGFLMNMGAAEQTHDLEQMRHSLNEAFRGSGAAVLAAVLNEGERTSRKTLSALRGWSMGEPAPIEVAANRFFAANPEANFRQIFEAGGAVDVIPMEVANVGPRVAESLDLGLRNAISLKSYMTGGLGTRIEAVVRRFDPADAARLETDFLAQAHSNAKSSFAVSGWKGVWNRDVERYFAEKGLSLPRIARYGFAVSTAIMKPYGGDPSAGRFLARSRTMSAAVPRDAVPTPSDPKAVSRYHSSIYGAVRKAIELLPDGPSRSAAPKIGIDNNAEPADKRPTGIEGPEKASDYFGSLADKAEPESGGQLDF